MELLLLTITLDLFTCQLFSVGSPLSWLELLVSLFIWGFRIIEILKNKFLTKPHKTVLIVMKFPETMIKISLIFVVILAGIIALVMFMTGSLIGGVIGLVFFGLMVWYARVRWE